MPTLLKHLSGLKTAFRMPGMHKALRRNALNLLVLVSFTLQSLYAPGTMAGQGSWVELCVAGSSDFQLVYLEDFPQSQHESQEEQCAFSGPAFATAHTIATTNLTSADCVLNSPLSVSLALKPPYSSHAARAPPSLCL